jgi:predicted RNA binding protein YcfA (HicA-like mRNA interferase family)
MLKRLDMPKGFYKELTDEISSLGFQYWKQAKGSHEKWRHPKTGVIVIVQRNLDSRHTANVVLKAAGSSKKF